MKLTRLALQNVKKSYKNYLIYFLTLMVSICLFYTFNSFQAQEELMALNESQSTMMQTVGIFMKVLSIFVAIILAFLVLYANNFLIKRRKKEFGLYMLLGMEKGDISKVLIYETICIGVLSLVAGLLLGVLCSQGLGIFTAHLFAVPVNYRLVFSAEAAITTVLSFGLIFLILMLFNTKIINKVKLIELLQAERRQEKARIQKPVVAVVLFLVSILLLGFTYYIATRSSSIFVAFLVPILIIGSIGTVLFFLSLSGFLLQFIRSSKTLYYRGLNMFMLRQVNAKVNTSFVAMSIVCLMLLLSIGALSVGWNLNDSLMDSIETQTPYSITLFQAKEAPASDIKKLLMLEESKEIQSSNQISVYTTDIKLKDLNSLAPDVDTGKLYAEGHLEIVTLSDYNAVMRAIKKPEQTLKPNEAFFFSGSEKLLPTLNAISEEANAPLRIYGQELKLRTLQETAVNLATAHGFSSSASIVIPDAILPADAKLTHTFWNIELKQEDHVAAYEKQVRNNLKVYWKDTLEKNGNYILMTRHMVEADLIGIGMLFIYIGLYLGIVFLIASAAILALQQLSEAEENRRRYAILAKIGTSEKLMNRSIYQQISIYFLLPLVLAIVHAAFGIPVVSTAMMDGMGVGDLNLSNILYAGIIVLIYGGYFLFTCHSYRIILYHPASRAIARKK